MKTNYPFVLIVLSSLLILSCSESDLLPTEKSENEIFVIDRNSISKIEVNTKVFEEALHTFALDTKIAARNNNFIVIGGRYSPAVDEDIIIYNHVEDDLITLDIDSLLDYSYEEARFIINDLMIHKQKVYVVGIKDNYFEESLLQLIEIDLQTKSITAHSEIAHENVVVNKYIKLIHDDLIYINFINKLEIYSIQELAKASESEIETSYFPGNIMTHDVQDILYYDFHAKKQFHISTDNFSTYSEKPLSSLKIEPLVRERSLAVLNNSVIGFYLKDSPFTVGVFQYNFKDMKMVKMLENENYNNTISEFGYYVIESKFIRVINDRIVFQGIIFNEEKSSYENMITVLDSDFNRIQSHNFDILSDEIIAIL